jgi:hypothetical protein
MIPVLVGLLAVVCTALPVRGADLWPPQTFAGPRTWSCYWCIRDAIYEDTRLINHLEANPDVDDAVKAPPVRAARADIHRLRAWLGPVQEIRPEPCCYWRKRLYIR